jgi:hypothetical protein
MSDLGGGRASNGGARTGGPVPVSSGTPTSMKTPRDVMRERTAREARKQEEQRAADRMADERRRSAERRAATLPGTTPRFTQASSSRAATVPGADPRYSQASSQYTPDVSAQQGQFDGAGDRRSSGGRVSGAEVLGEPVGRSQDYSVPVGRPRGLTAAGAAQPTPSSSAARPRTQQAQGTPRQPAAPAASASQPGPSSAESAQRNTASSFPHAFERWEQLSSHWEGLTSYWLHKLESNTEEIRNTVPNASTLNRQITDLSAAGANLFHAVVELQRLRASSERKFQRWFFETRADTERQQEMQAQTDRQMRLERSAREEAATQRAQAEEAASIARREVQEMRRELLISKEEARRAWEELGRRNQESLDVADTLKSGRVAVVGGVQVVPYSAEPSRTGSASQRPRTRDGPPYGSVAGASSAGPGVLGSPVDDEQYYRERPSPTNTDPFTEQQVVRPLHHEPDNPSLAAGTYDPSRSNPIMAQQAAAAAMGQRTPQPSTRIPTSSSPEAQRFYQHTPTETFLHSPPGSSSGGGGGPASSGQQSIPIRRDPVGSEGSYVETVSEGDTEYAVDAAGNIRHDENGRPIVYRRQPQQQRAPARSQVEDDSEDPYDEEAIRHERELAAQYAGRAGQQLPEAPSVPGTSAAAMSTYAPTTGAAGGTGGGQGPDYEGEGYGGWEAVQTTTRHHHPTRLSDVLEEEEERSSRHTGH